MLEPDPLQIDYSRHGPLAIHGCFCAALDDQAVDGQGAMTLLFEPFRPYGEARMESRSMNYPLIKPPRLTVAEFREMEANAPEDERWELINGVIYKSMAGGTVRHNDIVQNISQTLRAEFRRRGSPCRTSTENVRLDIDDAEVSTLPDVLVSCGPRPGGARTLTDAAAVVEVLSPSTSARDRGEKLNAYFRLASLRTVLLAEQNRMSVVSYTRSDGGWLLCEFFLPDDRVVFDGLDVALTLAQIYEDIDFDPA